MKQKTMAKKEINKLKKSIKDILYDNGIQSDIIVKKNIIIIDTEEEDRDENIEHIKVLKKELKLKTPKADGDGFIFKKGKYKIFIFGKDILYRKGKFINDYD